MGDRPRNRDALLFAARQNVRVAVFSVCELDRGQKLFNTLGDFRLRYAVELEDEPDVIRHRQCRYEIERLVNEADVLAPEQCPVALRHGRDVQARHLDLPGIGLIDATDDIQQSRFARATAAFERNRLAPNELGIETLEYGVQLVTFPKAAADTPDTDLDIVLCEDCAVH